MNGISLLSCVYLLGRFCHLLATSMAFSLLQKAGSVRCVMEVISVRKWFVSSNSPFVLTLTLYHSGAGTLYKAPLPQISFINFSWQRPEHSCNYMAAPLDVRQVDTTASSDAEELWVLSLTVHLFHGHEPTVSVDCQQHGLLHLVLAEEVYNSCRNLGEKPQMCFHCYRSFFTIRKMKRVHVILICDDTVAFLTLNRQIQVLVMKLELLDLAVPTLRRTSQWYQLEGTDHCCQLQPEGPRSLWIVCCPAPCMPFWTETKGGSSAKWGSLQLLVQN